MVVAQDKIIVPTRPVLKYHGGKWELAPWIISHFPSHRVYVEPFCGAGSVLLRKPCSHTEVLNDLDGEIVNLFRVLRNAELAAELERQLRYTPYARAEFELSYVASSDDLEQARRTIVRTFLGHGSAAFGQKVGFRSNSHSSGKAAAGSWSTYPDALAATVRRLRAVVIESRPALEIIEQHDATHTLFYLDPPYSLSTRYNKEKTKVYRFEMSDDEHRELAAKLRSVKAMVALSGYACELYDVELYPDWTRFEMPTLADCAVPRTEVLWLNEACHSALQSERQQKSLFDHFSSELNKEMEAHNMRGLERPEG